MQGTFGPFDPLNLTFNGADSAQNNDNTATLLTTSSVLDPADFPLFGDSKAVAAWQRPFASPFDPHDGNWFLSAGTDDAAYKRLLKPFSIPAGGGSVKLFTSFDLETDYDYMFVEIHTVGQDDWTTLEDANGHTSDDVGSSCPTDSEETGRRGRPSTRSSPTTRRSPTTATTAIRPDRAGRGTPRRATPAAGRSGICRSRPRTTGKNVEISVSVASDPAAQGLGVWVDELRVVDSADNPINTADPSFESTDMDGWTLPGPPPPNGDGTQSQATGWERAHSAPFIEAPVVTTTDTVYTGFAFEAITGAANRNAFMQSVLTHLGAPHKPVFNAPAPRVDPPPPPPPPPPPATTPVARQLSLALTTRQNLRYAVRPRRADAAQLQPGLPRARRPRRQHGRATLPQAPVAAHRAPHAHARAGPRSFRVPVTTAAKRRLLRAKSVNVSAQVTWLGVTPAIKKSGTIRLRK